MKILLQHALSKKVTLTVDDKVRVLTKAAAGIMQLVDQFARGDRHARRDLFDLADKLGLDLGAGSKAALEELSARELKAEDSAILDDFIRRRTVRPSDPIIPPTQNEDEIHDETQDDS
ncbi:hypothetical protein JQ586_36525 [Bradyrhizobium jicamae]|nr:hypothetical protein [Bradyrhizobium jicamae]